MRLHATEQCCCLLRILSSNQRAAFNISCARLPELGFAPVMNLQAHSRTVLVIKYSYQVSRSLMLTKQRHAANMHTLNSHGGAVQGSASALIQWVTPRATARRISAPPSTIPRAASVLAPSTVVAPPAPSAAELLGTVLNQYLQRKQHTTTFIQTPVHTVLLLEEIFDELEEIFYCRKGYNIPARERKVVDATGGSATYGEALPEGVDALRQVLDLGPDDVLYDLGSGTGRVILQLALTCDAKRLVGIELSPTRHEHAEEAVSIFRKRNMRHAPMEFLCDDIATCDISDGTHFYMCSTAYSASICRRMAERLSQSPNFQVLVTSRALPVQPFLQKLGELPSAYSWNINGKAFVYVKSLEQAPAKLLSKFCCRDGVAWLPGQTGIQQQGQQGQQKQKQLSVQLPVDEKLESSWPGEQVPVLMMPGLLDPIQHLGRFPGNYSGGVAADNSSNN